MTLKQYVSYWIAKRGLRLSKPLKKKVIRMSNKSLNMANLTLAEAADLVDMKMRVLSFEYFRKSLDDLYPHEFERLLNMAIDQVFSDIAFAKKTEKRSACEDG